MLPSGSEQTRTTSSAAAGRLGRLLSMSRAARSRLALMAPSSTAGAPDLRTAPKLSRGCDTGRVKRLVVLLVMLAVPAVAAAATSPFGATYKTTVKDQAPPLNGAWRMAFTANGGYSVTKPPSSTKLIVGKATVKGNTMTFRDSTGT